MCNKCKYTCTFQYSYYYYYTVKEWLMLETHLCFNDHKSSLSSAKLKFKSLTGEENWIPCKVRRWRHLLVENLQICQISSVCITWITQHGGNSSWQYFYNLSLWVSAVEVIQCACLGCQVTHFQVRMNHLSTYVYYRWIMTSFSGNWKRMATTRMFYSTYGWKSLVGNIYNQNCTAVRTATWNTARATKKKTSVYINQLLSPRMNKHGNNVKCLWNTLLR